MRPQVYAAAQKALQRAQQALGELERYGDRPEMTDKVLSAWTDLLMYGNQVFSKLEHDSKAEPFKSWFALHKDARKNDPLLAYLKCARDVAAHGFDPVAEAGAYSDLIEVPSGETGVNIFFDGPGTSGRMHTNTPGARVMRTRELREVKERSKIYYVPHEHLGAPVDNASPLIFGRLFVGYLHAMVSEADALRH